MREKANKSRERKRETEGIERTERGREEGTRCVWGGRNGMRWKIFSLIGDKAECTVHSAVSVSEHWDSPCPLSHLSSSPSALSEGSPHSSII